MRHQRSSTLQPHCQESQSEERLLRGHLAWLLLWIQVSKGITIGNLGKEVRFGLQDLGVTCPQAREEGGGEGRENTQSEMRGGSWQLVLLLRNMRVKMMGHGIFLLLYRSKGAVFGGWILTFAIIGFVSSLLLGGEILSATARWVLFSFQFNDEKTYPVFLYFFPLSLPLSFTGFVMLLKLAFYFKAQ